VPFPDESHPVRVLDYQPGWPAEFERLAAGLREVLGDLALGIDHVGSTSVPDLAAKDCIDIQVRVAAVDEATAGPPLAAAGFRLRPEPWNHSEVSGRVTCPKLVFAAPPGGRSANIHIRENAGSNARFALLFRDYLRADQAARQAWGAFKQRLAQSAPDIFDYGQIKAPATEILIQAAEAWASRTGWSMALYS
jgi:GrpB-like predicted nucleotidyltransferase (UPF0157 family)